MKVRQQNNQIFKNNYKFVAHLMRGLFGIQQHKWRDSQEQHARQSQHSGVWWQWSRHLSLQLHWSESKESSYISNISKCSTSKANSRFPMKNTPLQVLFLRYMYCHVRRVTIHVHMPRSHYIYFSACMEQT